MSLNKNQRTITSLVQDRPGVLSRISGLFAVINNKVPSTQEKPSKQFKRPCNVILL